MRQPQKMVKHTQTICRLLRTNCLSVFDHFVGMTVKGLKSDIVEINTYIYWIRWISVKINIVSDIEYYT